MDKLRKIFFVILVIISIIFMGIITYVGFFLPNGHYFLIRAMTVIVDLYIINSIRHAVRHDE